MSREANKNDHSDELYTITLSDQAETGEKIPERIYASEKIEYKKQEYVKAKPQESPVFISREQKKQDFYARHGLPPVLTSSALIARQAYYKPPVLQNPPNRKSFIEQAREYADKSHEKTDHIPFMCYWPSYEYMSQAQLNWYFYMRSCIRKHEYIDTDLSYLFLYIYELINQVGTGSPEDGLERLIDLWINYRSRYSKLDRYLTEWVGDYISLYKCDAEKAFERLKAEGLFLLMPTDMLADYYFSKGQVLPIELISRFSDYKIYESEFIKGEHGNLFTDHLVSLVNDIREHMNKINPGSFEKRELLILSARQHKRLPFQRALFHNPDNIRIESCLPYEQHKPLRIFIKAIIKEFENQLRKLTNYRGRLRPDSLPEDIKKLCIKHANNAFNGLQPEKKVEIKIDRNKLLELMQDSDEVRRRLIEGNDEYDDFMPADSDSSAEAASYGQLDIAKSDMIVEHKTQREAYDKEAENDTAEICIKQTEHNGAGKDITQANTVIPQADNALAQSNIVMPSANKSSTTENVNLRSANDMPSAYDTTADDNPANLGTQPDGSSSFRSRLTELQQNILDYLTAHGLSSSTAELSAAFPGIFVGVEIDKINDIALEEIGDLLICLEGERWFIIEDYIDEI